MVQFNKNYIDHCGTICKLVIYNNIFILKISRVQKKNIFITYTTICKGACRFLKNPSNKCYYIRKNQFSYIVTRRFDRNHNHLWFTFIPISLPPKISQNICPSRTNTVIRGRAVLFSFYIPTASRCWIYFVSEYQFVLAPQEATRTSTDHKPLSPPDRVKT